MQRKTSRVKRLLDLYRRLEQQDGVQLKRATASVFEAEAAVRRQSTLFRSANLDMRDAMADGNSLARSLAGAQKEIAVSKSEHLQQILDDRELTKKATREQYLASHLKSEQISCILELQASQQKVEEGRRLQALADDRFLSRKQWTEERKCKSTAPNQ